MSTYGWTRSSRCSAGDCVEVFYDDGEVLVRDSKLGNRSPIQRWTPEEWQELLRAIRLATDDELAVAHPAVSLIVSKDIWTVVVSGPRRQEKLRFDEAEWEAFCAGVEDGEFTPEVLAAASEDQPAAQPAEATDTAVSVAAGVVNANTAPAPNSANCSCTECASDAACPEHGVLAFLRAGGAVGPALEDSPAGRSDDSSRSLDGSAKLTAADQPGPQCTCNSGSGIPLTPKTGYHAGYCPALPVGALAYAATHTGHTVGCTCWTCDSRRALFMDIASYGSTDPVEDGER